MRICFVSQQVADIRTGVGMYANALIPAVAEAGHRTTLVARGRAPGWKDVDHHPVPAVPRDPTPEGWLSFAWIAARRLGALGGARAFDVVHFLDAREALFARRADGASLVGTVHDCYLAAASPDLSYWRSRYSDWVRRWAYHRLARRLERAALRKLDALIANSRYVERQVGAAYALPPRALRTIYHGFRFGWEARSAGSPSSDVLFVGANFERKGLPGLLRALARVRERVPDVHLHVAGDHPSRRHMEGLAGELGLAEHVIFHGFLPRADVAALYRGAAVLALPSEVEGFGITLMEAMHSGVPVIASTEGGSAELVRDGWNGFLVAPGDVATLADRLLVLLTDGQRRAEMAANGRETAGRYPLARMVAETLAVYREVA